MDKICFNLSLEISDFIFSNFRSLVPVIITFAPDSKKFLAISKPIPPVPPEISTTLSLSSDPDDGIIIIGVFIG